MREEKRISCRCALARNRRLRVLSDTPPRSLRQLLPVHRYQAGPNSFGKAVWQAIHKRWMYRPLANQFASQMQSRHPFTAGQTQKSPSCEQEGLFQYQRLFTAIDASACAGLMDANSGQFWQQRLELSKDPFGEVFAGRIFQSWNVIQVVVIESFIQGLEDRFDF